MALRHACWRLAGASGLVSKTTFIASSQIDVPSGRTGIWRLLGASATLRGSQHLPAGAQDWSFIAKRRRPVSFQVQEKQAHWREAATLRAMRRSVSGSVFCAAAQSKCAVAQATLCPV
jgi:hypothetical protein